MPAMNELAKTPETLIAQLLTLASELEKTPGMIGGNAGHIISGIKSDLAALKQLRIREKYHHQLRSNAQQNCRELYALTHAMADKVKNNTPRRQVI